MPFGVSSGGLAFNNTNYNNSNANTGDASHLSYYRGRGRANMAKNKLFQMVLVGSPKAPQRKQGMKRQNNLYNRICSRENILQAYHKARAGKSSSYGVKVFDSNLETNLEALYDDLDNDTYKTSEYSVFTIYEPKERIIFRLPFRDRIVQHAIMNILEPIWVPVFIHNTYSSIKGRGIHAVVRDLKRDLKDTENTEFCLKLDIRKFYPSIDHEILKTVIRKKIKDERLLLLLDGIIDSAPGVPIGNYLSQFFANLYLSYFDHWLKETLKVKYYYRYADDMVILGATKPELHKIRVEIDHYLKENLNLDVKDNYQVFPVDSRGIDFVGYVFYHSHVLMRKTIKKRLCRKVAKLNKRKNVTDKEYKIKIAPWIGWAKHCNSKHLLKTVLNEKIF